MGERMSAVKARDFKYNEFCFQHKYAQRAMHNFPDTVFGCFSYLDDFHFDSYLFFCVCGSNKVSIADVSLSTFTAAYLRMMKYLYRHISFPLSILFYQSWLDFIAEWFSPVITSDLNIRTCLSIFES